MFVSDRIDPLIGRFNSTLARGKQANKSLFSIQVICPAEIVYQYYSGVPITAL